MLKQVQNESRKPQIQPSQSNSITVDSMMDILGQRAAEIIDILDEVSLFTGLPVETIVFSREKFQGNNPNKFKYNVRIKMDV